jgi:hypothetical protein
LLLAAPAAAADTCEAEFTVDGLIGMLKSGTLPAVAAPHTGHLKNHSVCYVQCLAYAREDLSLCKRLKGLKFEAALGNSRAESVAGDLQCRDHLSDLRFAKAFIDRSPDFDAVCRRNFEQGKSKSVALEKAAAVCKLEAEHFEDPKALCEALSAYNGSPRERAKCEPFFRGLSGDDEGCDALPQGTHIQQRCYEYAAYARSRKAKDESACGKSPLCRLFWGRGEAACEGYADELRAMTCRGKM